MLIKDTQYKKCGECSRTESISEPIYGCDTCKAEIDLNRSSSSGKGSGYLKVTVFHEESSTQNLEFCSWDCFFAKVPKIKSDYFMSLPYLMFDETDNKINAKGFFRAAKKFGSK